MLSCLIVISHAQSGLQQLPATVQGHCDHQVHVLLFALRALLPRKSVSDLWHLHGEQFMWLKLHVSLVLTFGTNLQVGVDTIGLVSQSSASRAAK